MLPKDSLGETVHDTLKHWSALSRYTEAGQLDAPTNCTEHCMKALAAEIKALFFAGSERAGHSAAPYYSLVESCKASQPSQPTYLYRQQRAEQNNAAADS